MTRKAAMYSNPQNILSGAGGSMLLAPLKKQIFREC